MVETAQHRIPLFPPSDLVSGDNDEQVFDIDILTHHGLIMPYGGIDPGKHWLR